MSYPGHFTRLHRTAIAANVSAPAAAQLTQPSGCLVTCGRTHARFRFTLGADAQAATIGFYAWDIEEAGNKQDEVVNHFTLMGVLTVTGGTLAVPGSTIATFVAVMPITSFSGRTCRESTSSLKPF